MKSKVKNVILYHGGCTDGFGAAWAAWKKFGTKAEYIASNHDDPIPENIEGKNVYMLDISYNLSKTKKLLRAAKKLTILDHHKSVESSAKVADEYVYDASHSGATIAWKFFHPKKKTPSFIRYVEGMDIWKFLPGNLEFSAATESYERNFLLWDKLIKGWEKKSSRKEYLNEGSSILRYKNMLIKSALKNADEVNFLGHKALVVNFALNLNSEIGDAMRKNGYHLGIIWQKRQSKIIVSLRSSDEVDSSKIAAKFGGGGHKNAAAFRLPAKIKFPWKSLKK